MTMTWPEGFIWGTASSATQAEGAAAGSDWYAWEEQGRVPRSGDGNGFATRHGEDFAGGNVCNEPAFGINAARQPRRGGGFDKRASVKCGTADRDAVWTLSLGWPRRVRRGGCRC